MPPLSSTRITIDSPRTVGSVATRMSMWRPSTFRPTRPSWGMRFSAMSRSAMIFTRETRPAIMPRGTVVVSLTTPSTRKRTRIDLASGSKWMSEAPRSTASATIERTSLTTGASSADSRSSMTGRLVVLLLDLLDGGVEPAEAAEEGVHVLLGGDRAADLVAGHHRQVVDGEHVRRVGGGHQHHVVVEEGDRDGAVLAQHRGVDQRRRALVDRVAVEVHVLDAVPLGDGAGELIGRHDAVLEQGLAGGAAGLAGLDHGALHRVAAGEVVVGDDVADAAQRVRPRRGSGLRQGRYREWSRFPYRHFVHMVDPQIRLEGNREGVRDRRIWLHRRGSDQTARERRRGGQGARTVRVLRGQGPRARRGAVRWGTSTRSTHGRGRHRLRRGLPRGGVRGAVGPVERVPGRHGGRHRKRPRRLPRRRREAVRARGHRGGAGGRQRAGERRRDLAAEARLARLLPAQQGARRAAGGGGQRRGRDGDRGRASAVRLGARGHHAAAGDRRADPLRQVRLGRWRRQPHLDRARGQRGRGAGAGGREGARRRGLLRYRRRPDRVQGDDHRAGRHPGRGAREAERAGCRGEGRRRRWRRACGARCG